LLTGPSEHKARFIWCEAGSCSVDVPLVFFKTCHERCDVVIDLTIARNLSYEAPIVGVGDGLLEDLKVALRSSEHVVEPRR
jgi:hypothetical protein